MVRVLLRAKSLSIVAGGQSVGLLLHEPVPTAHETAAFAPKHAGIQQKFNGITASMLAALPLYVTASISKSMNARIIADAGRHSAGHH